MSEVKRAVIIANGMISDLEQALGAIKPGDLLIAADGGAQNYVRLGLVPQVVIGDLDSILDDLRTQLVSHQTQFITFPVDKDQTDLELALSYAVSQGATDIMLLGLLGGRLDQTLANLLLVSRSEWSAARLTTTDGVDTATLMRSEQTLSIAGQIGDTVSLIPLATQVTGVYTQGLRWSLHDAELEFGSTRGISNEMITQQVQIMVGEGQLLVVHRKRSESDKL